MRLLVPHEAMVLTLNSLPKLSVASIRLDNSFVTSETVSVCFFSGLNLNPSSGPL